MDDIIARINELGTQLQRMISERAPVPDLRDVSEQIQGLLQDLEEHLDEIEEHESARPKPSSIIGMENYRSVAITNEIIEKLTDLARSIGRDRRGHNMPTLTRNLVEFQKIVSKLLKDYGIDLVEFNNMREGDGSIRNLGTFIDMAKRAHAGEEIDRREFSRYGSQLLLWVRVDYARNPYHGGKRRTSRKLKNKTRKMRK